MKELKTCRVDKYDPMEIDGEIIRKNEWLVDFYTYEDTDTWCRAVFKLVNWDDGYQAFQLTDIYEYTNDLHLKYFDELEFFSERTSDFEKFVEDNEIDVAKAILGLAWKAHGATAKVCDDLERLIEEES